MKKSIIIIFSLLLLLLPLVTILIVFLSAKINIFDNADFWYNYMAYFGTVALAAVAVWQTKKANDISQTLLEMEVDKKTPRVDIRGITEADFKSSNTANYLNTLVDGCFSQYGREWEKNAWHGTALIFALKNLKETDILNISVSEVSSAILAENELFDKKKHKCSNSASIQTIAPSETIPFVLNIPDELFQKVAEFDIKKQASLFLAMNISMQNCDGKRYIQRIEMNIVNAYQREIISPVIINKKLVQVVPAEKYKEIKL